MPLGRRASCSSSEDRLISSPVGVSRGDVSRTNWPIFPLVGRDPPGGFRNAEAPRDRGSREGETSMETRRETRFDAAHRAVQATGRILASCKALLGRLGDELRSLELDLAQLRRRLNDPVIAEALAAVAELEGTAAPVEPIFGWPIEGLIRTWPHEL